MTIKPVCEDGTMSDIYIWDINAGGVELVINRDSPDKLRVRTGYAGESVLTIDQVNEFHEKLRDIREWMLKTRTSDGLRESIYPDGGDMEP